MKKIIIVVALLAGVGVVGYRAWESYKAKGEVAAEGGGPGGSRGGGFRGGGMAMRVPLVDTVVATEGSFEERVTLIGSLRPIAEVQVMSKVAGRIEKITGDVGDSVRAGSLLATVEDREIQQQQQQAEAALAVSRASIQQREVELENLTRQVVRYRELHEQNLISRQDLEDLVTRQQAGKAQLELSRAQFRQAEANLNQIRITLENTRVFSPMDGFVSRRFLHPGALIGVNTPILNLVDLRTLRVVVNVVERDIVRLRQGSPASVTVDAFPGRTFSGRVLRVSPVMDPATRTGEVEVHVSNSQLDLRAEMFARVTLDLGSGRKGILLPRESIVYRGEESGVFVLDGSTAKFRPVRVGVTQQASVEIVDGVRLGDRVVSMGSSLLKDGDRVRLPGEASGREGGAPPAGASPEKDRRPGKEGGPPREGGAREKTTS